MLIKWQQEKQHGEEHLSLKNQRRKDQEYTLKQKPLEVKIVETIKNNIEDKEDKIKKMKLSNIIFEGFRERVSYMNHKEYTVNWIGTADTLKDFAEAIERIPDTIEYINIPINTRIFMTTDHDDKKIQPQGNWKKEVIDTVTRVVGEHEKEGNKLEGIRISSYYSVGPRGADEHPIYVSIDTKESREFGDAMSRGDYGPLD